MLAILKRINELSKLQKGQGLSEMEKAEQADLRQAYLHQFRGTINSVLLNVTIIDPNGDDVTPEKLKREQGRLD